MHDYDPISKNMYVDARHKNIRNEKAHRHAFNVNHDKVFALVLFLLK